MALFSLKGGVIMAKKKKEELSYLQMPLPAEAKAKRTVRLNWSGLNKTQTLDTGELSFEHNISTYEAPYLTPSMKRKNLLTYNGSTPISMFGFDDFLLVIYKFGDNVKIDHYTNIDYGPVIRTGTMGSGNNTTEQRCVVQFNILEPSNPVDGVTKKKLIIFPDKVSMDFKPTTPLFYPAQISPMPNIKYATVRLSRIFGLGRGTNSNAIDRIFVSAFMDHARWELDTATEYNTANAWASVAMSNVRATGDFTGITTYLNSAVTFKRDYIHEVTGSANPFKLNDIYAEGAIDQRSIVDVDGNLIFVSDDAVKVYTGGNPRILSYKLNVRQFNKAVAGTDGRRYYLYCEDERWNKHLFVYDTVIMQWAEEHIEEEVLSFAKNNDGFYMLTAGGTIYRVDSGDYNGQSWSAETDLTAGQTIDIKHIQKIQILADVGAGSTIKAHLIYDGENNPQEIYSYTNALGVEKRAAIRVVPRNTAHWGAKLRLSGTGFSRVYQAEITLKGGGEMYV
jgi:hypothetical protein